MTHPKHKGGVPPMEQLHDLIRRIENLRPGLLAYIQTSPKNARHNLEAEAGNLHHETGIWLAQLERVQGGDHGSR